LLRRRSIAGNNIRFSWVNLAAVEVNSELSDFPTLTGKGSVSARYNGRVETEREEIRRGRTWGDYLSTVLWF